MYFKDESVLLEIPEFCLKKDSYLKIKWLVKNDGSYSPKIYFYFKSKIERISFVNFRHFRTNILILDVNTKPLTNLIQNVKICFKTSNLLKSNVFFDFNYFSSSRFKVNQSLRKIINHKSSETFFKKPHKEYKDFPVDLIPINFTRFNNFKQTFYLLKEFSNLKNNKDPERNIICLKDQNLSLLGLDKRSVFSYFSKKKKGIDFRVDLIPIKPIYSLQKSLKFIPAFAIGFVLRLYKHRPIWNKKIIENYLPFSLKKYTKNIFPIVSYRFKGLNPFRETWIRFKFEPRKGHKNRIYQISSFEKTFYKNQTKKKHFVSNSNRTNIKKKKFWKNFSPSLKGKSPNEQTQVCDLDKNNYEKMLKLKVSKTVTSRKGWFL